MNRTLPAVVLLLAIAAGCTSLARRIDQYAAFATRPTNTQDCRAMIALAQAERAGIAARKQALEELKSVYPKLDNKDTSNTISEMNANIAWIDDQIRQLEALLPTLPDKPTTSGTSPTPGGAGQ